MKGLRSTILGFCFFHAALTLGGERFSAALPTHTIFPTTTGIIFPSLLSAAGINPAALPQRGAPATAFGVNYSPPPGGQQHEYSASFATANKQYGLGLGTLGGAGDTASNAVFAGAGFRSESTSLGLAIRDDNLSDGFTPQTDIGVIAAGSELSYGLVLYHLESAPQLDFGLGFGKDKSYNFELNVLMPPFGSMFTPGSAFTFTAATTVYVGIFGISFVSSYVTNPAQVSQGVSALVWIFKNFGLTIQYRSPNRSYYGFIATF